MSQHSSHSRAKKPLATVPEDSDHSFDDGDDSREDPNYSPSDDGEKPPASDITPKMNPFKKGSVTPDRKEKLVKYSNGRHCLITLEESPKSAIQVAHIVPQAIHRNLV